MNKQELNQLAEKILNGERLTRREFLIASGNIVLAVLLAACTVPGAPRPEEMDAGATQRAEQEIDRQLTEREKDACSMAAALTLGGLSGNPALMELMERQARYNFVKAKTSPDRRIQIGGVRGDWYVVNHDPEKLFPNLELAASKSSIVVWDPGDGKDSGRFMRLVEPGSKQAMGFVAEREVWAAQIDINVPDTLEKQRYFSRLRLEGKVTVGKKEFEALIIPEGPPSLRTLLATGRMSYMDLYRVIEEVNTLQFKLYARTGMALLDAIPANIGWDPVRGTVFFLDAEPRGLLTNLSDPLIALQMTFGVTANLLEKFGAVPWRVADSIQRAALEAPGVNLKRLPTGITPESFPGVKELDNGWIEVSVTNSRGNPVKVELKLGSEVMEKVPGGSAPVIVGGYAPQENSPRGVLLTWIKDNAFVGPIIDITNRVMPVVVGFEALIAALPQNSETLVLQALQPTGGVGSLGENQTRVKVVELFGAVKELTNHRLNPDVGKYNPVGQWLADFELAMAQGYLDGSEANRYAGFVRSHLLKVGDGGWVMLQMPADVKAGSGKQTNLWLNISGSTLPGLGLTEDVGCLTCVVVEPDPDGRVGVVLQVSGDFRKGELEQAGDGRSFLVGQKLYNMVYDPSRQEIVFEPATNL
jgi:hypothetical protein